MINANNAKIRANKVIAAQLEMKRKNAYKFVDEVLSYEIEAAADKGLFEVNCQFPPASTTSYSQINEILADLGYEVETPLSCGRTRLIRWN